MRSQRHEAGIAALTRSILRSSSNDRVFLCDKTATKKWNQHGPEGWETQDMSDNDAN
jgi:hypothetical protein